MAFETPQDASSSNSAVHPAQVDPGSDSPTQSVRPSDSPEGPAPPTETAGKLLAMPWLTRHAPQYSQATPYMPPGLQTMHVVMQW